MFIKPIGKINSLKDKTTIKYNVLELWWGKNKNWTALSVGTGEYTDCISLHK